MLDDTKTPARSSFGAAVSLVADYLRAPRKVDLLLDSVLRDEAGVSRRVGFLVHGVLRDFLRLDRALASLIHRPPPPRLRALLLVAAHELDLEPDKAPLIVDHAVGQARAHGGKAWAGLANAVLRKTPEMLTSVGPAAAHPDWLVERWRRTFPPAVVEFLLRWNQTPPPLYAVIPQPDDRASFRASRWQGYVEISGSDWPALQPLIATGRAYVQDPFARHAVELLGHFSGDVLDLAAAPGGKSFLLSRRLRDPGQTLVSVDLPGPRLERLRENLARVASQVAGRIVVEGADLSSLTPEALVAVGLPPRYPQVLLDVPCSNTGVLRRRPDAKLRLQPDDLSRLPPLQGRLLASASAFVNSPGSLVYSTCSLEPDENHGVVRAFLAAHPDFHLETERVSTPWEDHHDGGYAALLRRR